MTTLQEMLHSRVGGDQRAHVGVIETQAGRVRILFGPVGDNPRVTLGVDGNSVTILHPTNMPNPVDGAAEARRAQMTPDNVQPGSNLPPNSFSLAGGGEFEVRDGLLFSKDNGEPLFLYSQAMLDAMRVSPVDTQAGQPIERPQTAGGEPGAQHAPDGDNGPALDSDPDAPPPPAGDGPGAPAGGSKPEPIDYKAHDKPSLIALAKLRNVTIDESATKAVIAAAINKAAETPA